MASTRADKMVNHPKTGAGARLGLLAMAGTGLLLACCLASAVTIYLFGRSHPLQATRPWLITLAVVLLLTAAWQGIFIARLLTKSPAIRRRAVPPILSWSLTLSVTLAAIVAAVYAFDDFNHRYTADPEFRGLFAVLLPAALYITAEIQRAVLSNPVGSSIMGALAAQARLQAKPFALVATAAIGLLLGTSYITAIGDDYARYWTIADALASGWGYPASEVERVYQTGGLSSYLVDLPVLPVLMVASFTLLGHNVLAAMLPAFLGGSLFVLAAYLAFKELTDDILLAFVGAVAVATFPLLTFYVLRAAEPDGIFITLLMLMAFLAIRADRMPESKPAWPLLGLAASMAALIRPEGIMYAGITFLFLLPRHWKRSGIWTASLAAAVPVGIFSAVMLTTFGAPWPTSFAGTMKLDNVAANWSGLTGSAIPAYAAALGLPEPVLVAFIGAALVLYMVGAWRLAKGRPQLLFLALLPALNLITFFLASPNLTRPQHPYDFFRRLSYGLPYAALVSVYPLGDWLRQAFEHNSRRTAMTVLVAASLVLVTYQVKLLSRPETTYEFGTPLLTSGMYLLATDLAERPYEMPRMTYERDGAVVVVSDSFDYMAFRKGLNETFEPRDLHGRVRAMGYSSAVLALFLIGLFHVAARRTERGEETVREAILRRAG